MKPFRLITLLAASVIATTPLLAADFGLRVGRYNESSQDFVGAEVVFDLGTIKLNPNVEYLLDDAVTAGSANIDVTVDLARFGTATPYLGAGVGLAYVSEDATSDTQALGNLIGGVAFDLDFLEPYAQVKYFRGLDDDASEDEFALTVGVRF